MSGFVFDATKKESEKDLGGDRPEGEGRFHVMVKNAEQKHYPAKPAEGKEAQDKWIVDFEILAGTLPGQEGKVHKEHYSLSANAIDKAMRLAFMGGLLKPGEKKELHVGNLVGHQLIIELVKGKDWTNNKGEKQEGNLQIAFPGSKSMGVWRLDDPDVAAVPRNAKAATLAAPSTPAASGSAPTTPAASAAPAAASSWDDV